MDKNGPVCPKRRRKKVFICPNPLFEQWLGEWKDEAAEKGWKSQYIYAKALNSLKKYPLPLNSGKEAKLLENFGDKICKMLDEKLKEYNLQQASANTCDSDDGEQNNKDSNSHLITNVPDSPSKKQKRKRQIPQENEKQYVPAPRSGSYAILVALYKLECENQQLRVRKSDLQDLAQKYCDSSFRVRPSGSYYTAWNSMGQLIKKGLVVKDCTPAWYSLTESGRNLAILLLGAENDKEIDDLSPVSSDLSCTSPAKCITQTASDMIIVKKSLQAKNCESTLPIVIEDIVSEDHLPSSSAQLSKTQPPSISNVANSDTITKKFGTGFILDPGTYDIILCVDNCETTVWSKKNRQKEVLEEMKKNAVPCDIRKLNVGDFIWVAREKVHPIPGSLRPPVPRELALNYIVERKRMDDLAQSIRDGRFHEQKFRLKNSGLSHPIYLVEEFGKGENFSIPESSLEQAIVNTQVIDGFTVKRTKDHKESVAYLTVMTRYLQQMFAHRKLICGSKEEVQDPDCPSDIFMTFQEFNFTSLKNKRLTVREMFAKHLLQLHGLSVDKAAAIVEKYPTPSSLIDDYGMYSTEDEKEKLLASLKYGSSKRNIGPVLSRALYQLYCTER